MKWESKICGYKRKRTARLYYLWMKDIFMMMIIMITKKDKTCLRLDEHFLTASVVKIHRVCWQVWDWSQVSEFSTFYCTEPVFVFFTPLWSKKHRLRQPFSSSVTKSAATGGLWPNQANWRWLVEERISDSCTNRLDWWYLDVRALPLCVSERKRKKKNH